MNAVVKMQWVALHSLAQPDSSIQWRVYTTYLAAVNIEALQMQFTFRNNNRFAEHVIDNGVSKTAAEFYVWKVFEEGSQSWNLL